MSYAGKNAHSDDKTSGVLRGGVSGATRCYVLAHCVCGGFGNFPQIFSQFYFDASPYDICNTVTDPKIELNCEIAQHNMQILYFLLRIKEFPVF